MQSRSVNHLTTTFDDQEYWKATEEAGPESVHLIHMRNSRMNCHNIEEEEDTYIQYSKLLIKYHGISQEATPPPPGTHKMQGFTKSTTPVAKCTFGKPRITSV
jgi:hypothetical protein